MRQSLTFRDVLKGLEIPNSRHVMQRALLANRIAKLADAPLARRRAYGVKTRALEHAIAKFPEAFALSSAEDGGRVLGIRFQRECALHVLARDLSAVSREWVRRQGAGIAQAHRDYVARYDAAEAA